MMRFDSILNSACAAVGVRAGDKEAVLEAATAMLARGGGVLDHGKLLADVRAREALVSTGIGDGVAVPHALSEAVPATTMAAFSLASPVDFDAVDGQPVDLVFAIAGPADGSADHLKLLSKLARALHDPAFREAARAAPDGESLARLLYDKD